MMILVSRKTKHLTQKHIITNVYSNYPRFSYAYHIWTVMTYDLLVVLSAPSADDSRGTIIKYD